MKNIISSLLLLFLFSGKLLAEKKAFIVTISTFKDGFSEISSANDKFLIEQSLRRQGFENFTFVSENNATYKGITSALATFVKNLKPNDIVYMQFSTHGRQVQDYSKDEIDGLDEALVCYDSKMEGTKDIKSVIGTYLIDDTLERVVKDIRKQIGKNGDLCIALDACHSGTGTRGDAIKRGGYDALTDASYKMSTNMEPESFFSKSIVDDLAPFVVISGSQADVCNYEVTNLPLAVRKLLPIKDKQSGSLTYAIYNALNSIQPQTDKFTYRKLYEDIKLNMAELEKVQVPTIEGNGIDRELFGGKFVAQKKYYTIDSLHKDRTISLKAGLANGLYKGTKVYFCKSGTLEPAPENTIAKGSVKEENLFKTLISLDSIVDVPKNAWVFVYEQAFNNTGIKIDLSQASADFKKYLLLDLKFLQEVKPDENPELVLINTTLAGSTPSYTIKRTKDQQTIFYNSSITNLNPASDEGFMNIKNYITDYYQYKNISAIDIKSKNYKVEFTVLLVRNGDTCRACTNARMVNGMLELYEGDTIKYLLVNKGRDAAYFNILDLQPDGRIGLIYTGKNQNVNPSDLFIKDKEAVKLFPSGKDNTIVIGPPFGVDIFKLIAFSYPEDLSDLQINYASRKGIMSKTLGSLIRSSNDTRGAENKRTAEPSKEEDGATFDYPYVIKPKPVQ